LFWARAEVFLTEFDSVKDDTLLVSADECLMAAAIAGEQEKQKLWLAWIDYERARVARRRRQFDRGRRYSYRAMGSFAQMRHRYGTARCRLEVGRSYLDQREMQLALPIIEEARQTFSTCGDRWIEGHAALSLADAQRALNRRREAAREAQRSLSLFNEVGDAGAVALARNVICALIESDESAVAQPAIAARATADAGPPSSAGGWGVGP
jgi:hypothetical protein